MKAVLNFMYHGEVNVAQDSLNNFLAVAEELAVKGLTTDSKPAGTDTPAKKAVVSQKQKRSLPPGNYPILLCFCTIQFDLELV